MKTTKRFWLTALVALVIGVLSFLVPSWLIAAEEDPIAIIGGFRPPYWLLAANRCGGLFVFIAGACAVTAVLALLLWLYHALSKGEGLRKTSLLSALLGVACSFGVYCGLNFIGIALAQAAFGGVMAEYPFETVGSELGLMIAFCAVVTLVWLIAAQKGKHTGGAFMADLLLFVIAGGLTLPLWGLLESVGSWLVHLLGL